MRQLTPLTNLLLAALSAVALTASLSLPWYGLAPTSDPEAVGAMERHAHTVARVFTDAGFAGRGAIADTATVIVWAAVAVGLLAAAMLVPVLRPLVRDVLRATGVATPAIVAYAAVQGMGPGMEVRWGLLASVAVAAFMASAAWHGGAARAKRPEPGAWARAFRPRA